MMPMYVSPEQLMADRGDYARKGIARGRSMVVLTYADGIALVAENSSATLRKISEIYDRIAFGGVGRYNEFDNLRVGGVRYAELTGYSYSRRDVEARGLANQYSQMLGHIFTHEMKPLEVEIVVVELGTADRPNEIYRIQYEGTVMDEDHVCCIGGNSEAVLSLVREVGGYEPTISRNEAIALAADALCGPGEEPSAASLEVALLEQPVESGFGDDALGQRCFVRLDDGQVADALSQAGRSPIATATVAESDGAPTDAASGDAAEASPPTEPPDVPAD